MNYLVKVADLSHFHYAPIICHMMEEAAKVRGTGIAKREPEYLQKKMSEGKAVIALSQDSVIGFCYVESWEGKKYVANSGLIVHPDYRKTGLARAIKSAIFKLSMELYPDSKLFGITTSLAVMKINSDLGYKPVTFSELTQDESFWKGCQSCVNFDVLQRTNRSMCMCTGMMYSAKDEKTPVVENKTQRWGGFKRFMSERGKRLQKLIPSFPSLKPALKQVKQSDKK